MGEPSSMHGAAMIEWTLANEQATARLGAALAERLQPGEAVCLYGPLGAGKSTVARALIRALTRPDEDVPSPTFTLVQTYPAREFEIAHFDLYRLTSAGEVDELGLDEALETGVAIIEWPQRLEGRLPADRLDIHLELLAEAGEGRRARLEGFGTWSGRERELVDG